MVVCVHMRDYARVITSFLRVLWRGSHDRFDGVCRPHNKNSSDERASRRQREYLETTAWRHDTGTSEGEGVAANMPAWQGGYSVSASSKVMHETPTLTTREDPMMGLSFLPAAPLDNGSQTASRPRRNVALRTWCFVQRRQQSHACPFVGDGDNLSFMYVSRARA